MWPSPWETAGWRGLRPGWKCGPGPRTMGCARRPGGRSKGSADLSIEPPAAGWLGMRLVQWWDGTGAGETILEETRSEEHTSELQSLRHLVCRLLLEKKTR